MQDTVSLASLDIVEVQRDALITDFPGLTLRFGVFLKKEQTFIHSFQYHSRGEKKKTQ